MRVHHLACATLCPPLGRLLLGPPGHMVCHCLVAESRAGLVLVDTGLGLADLERPWSRLGAGFRLFIRPRLDPAGSAVRQVAALGLDSRDVRHLVPTHLDLDHAGGMPDFPEAAVHVLDAEHAAATRPGWRDRTRYRQVHWAHGPRWQIHRAGAGGDRWLGFECVRPIPSLEDEVALVPLAGHSRGHAGVAVRGESGWLLHAGDAYFHRGQVDPAAPGCPLALRCFQWALAPDREAARANVGRLAELARERAGEVTVFCAHDPEEWARVREKPS